MKLNLVPPEEDDAIDLTPMLTVLFLLVLFVVLLSTYFEEAPGYRLELPMADASQVIARDEADSVTLTANQEIWYRDGAGEIRLNSFQDLEDGLKARTDPNRPIVLRCDRHCTFEQFTHLKNAVMNAGVGTIFEEMGISH